MVRVEYSGQNSVKAYRKQHRITTHTLYCSPTADCATQIHDAKLTGPFLSCEVAGPRDYLRRSFPFWIFFLFTVAVAMEDLGVWIR